MLLNKVKGKITAIVNWVALNEASCW